MKNLLIIILAFFSSIAAAIPLDTIGTFCSTFPAQCQKGTESLMAVRGSGTNAYYVLEANPTTGAIPVDASGSTIIVTSPAVGPTGSAVPADASYGGLNSSGTLIGAIGDSSGRTIVAGAGTAGSANGGILTVQGVTSMTPLLATGTGTAGSAAAGVVTVQGITSMTPLLVNGSGSTQPVSGTVAATESGVWNITNVSGTVSLPTGAATEASLVKLPLAQASTTSGQSGALVQGAVTTAAPSYTTAQTSPLSLTTGGALRVDASASTQPISGTVAVTQSTSPWVTDQTTAAATFQDGAIAFGSLTTSYATVVTTGGVARIVQLRNGTNATVLVSLDGGSTTAYTLDSGDAISDDLKVNGKSIAISTALQAKYSGSAPTSGSIRINVVY